MQQTARPIGRPRDPSVIERDEHIYHLIAEGTGTRSELATATGLDRATVQLSCRRLHKAGRIRKCLADTIVWSVADGAPCP